ncbi:O-antigen polysaccharide polymerase Wzy [Enterococcus faecium]|nr:O-antigen polysaccharide polymerase Wzy [Enterococcus faecium]
MYGLLWIFSCTIGLSLFEWVNDSHMNLDTLKYLLCWVGIGTYVFCIFSWKIITGRIVTLYPIFITFLFLFNFGQCLTWAFGIHTIKDIDVLSLYYRLGVATTQEIIKTQIIIILAILSIHCGAAGVKYSLIEKNKTRQKYVEKNTSMYQEIYVFSKFLFPIVIISDLYYRVSEAINAMHYGYTALYYNSSIPHINVVFMVLSRLTFPVLLGLLIGSKYNPKVVKVVYATFLVKILLHLISGDRGGWIYGFCVLFVFHVIFYKKINWIKLFPLGISGYFAVRILVTIKRIRNSGFTLDKFVSTFFSLKSGVISEAIAELGGTMGITASLIKQGWNIYPYGNTFFYGLITMPTSDIAKILNLNYQPISDWFSQTYLRISNGAGFSIIAEMLINFGPVFMMFFLYIFGMFVAWFTNIENCTIENNALRLMLCGMTTAVMINISRNAFNYNIGEVFYTTFQWLIYYYVFCSFRRRRLCY